MSKAPIYIFSSIVLLGTFGFFNPNLREAYESYQHEKEMEKLVIQTNTMFENYNSITRKMSASLNSQKELVISHVELNGQIKEASNNPFGNAMFQTAFYSEQMKMSYCNEYRKQIQYSKTFHIYLDINNGTYVRNFTCEEIGI